MFDPYSAWLGIPKTEQPANNYQLLGIAPDEVSPAVIKEAALQQTARVRVYQTGPHAELCTRVLNEIAQARSTLLNPKTRLEHDGRLPPPTAVPAAPAAPAPIARNTDRDQIPILALPSRPSLAPGRPRAAQASDWLAALAYFVLLLRGGAGTFWATSQWLQSAALLHEEPVKAGSPAKSKGSHPPVPARGGRPP